MFLNIELNCQMTVEKDISYVIEKKKTKKNTHTSKTHIYKRALHGRGRMVVGFTATCTISAYHN
jgi:hypothetical protein